MFDWISITRKNVAVLGIILTFICSCFLFISCCYYFNYVIITKKGIRFGFRIYYYFIPWDAVKSVRYKESLHWPNRGWEFFSKYYIIENRDKILRGKYYNKRKLSCYILVTKRSKKVLKFYMGEKFNINK